MSRLTKFGTAVVPLSWFPSCSFEEYRFVSRANGILSGKAALMPWSVMALEVVFVAWG